MTTGWKVTIVGGIVGTVAGGLILQAIGAVDFGGAARAFGQWLAASATMPRWIVALFCLLAGANVLALILFFRRKRSTPLWVSYFTDLFFDVRWRWQYHSNDYSINEASIVPFCPRCDHRLIAEQRSKSSTPPTGPGPRSVTDAWLQFHPTPQTTFRCEACGFSRTEDGAVADFPRRVAWAVDQRIRNGDWSQVTTQA